MYSKEMIKSEDRRLIVKHNDHTDIEECPDCGSPVKRHEFESCHSGSVNSHYTLNCLHCDYHECDQDVCDECSSSELTTPSGYNEAIQLELWVDALVDKFQDTGKLSLFDWSHFKLFIHNNQDALDWWCLFTCEAKNITPFEMKNYVQRKMLAVRFIERINLQIDEAKIS